MAVYCKLSWYRSRPTHTVALLHVCSSPHSVETNVSELLKVCTPPLGRVQQNYSNIKHRVTTCLENLEMSGNLKHVRDNVNSQGIVREESGKNYCQGKLARLGGQMKKISRLANARHNPPEQIS